MKKFWIERFDDFTVCTEIDHGDGPESVGLATFETVVVDGVTVFDGGLEAQRFLARLRRAV